MNDQSKQIKVCAITGGSSGVGLAAAQKFTDAGYHVAICGRDQARLDDALTLIESNQPRSIAFQTDLSVPGNGRRFIEQVFNQFGRIDILLNNAGVAPLGEIDKLTDQEIEQCRKLNIDAVVETARAFWPIAKSQSGGVILNISSMAAVDPFPGFSVYGASKAWVELFTKAIADEGKQLDISCYAFRLGAVETPMLRGLFPEFPQSQALDPKIVAESLLRFAEERPADKVGQAIEVVR